MPNPRSWIFAIELEIPTRPEDFRPDEDVWQAERRAIEERLRPELARVQNALGGLYTILNYQKRAQQLMQFMMKPHD